MKRVRETLSKAADVESVEVDFKAKTATVTMKAGKTWAKTDAEAALKGSQYSVSSFDKKDAKKPS